MPRPTRCLPRTAPAGGLRRERMGCCLSCWSAIGLFLFRLFDRDEVQHLLDHPSERRRVVDRDRRARTPETEPLQDFDLIGDTAGATPNLRDLELGFHGRFLTTPRTEGGYLDISPSPVMERAGVRPLISRP